jgi:hypothetical protein
MRLFLFMQAKRMVLAGIKSGPARRLSKEGESAYNEKPDVQSFLVKFQRFRKTASAFPRSGTPNCPCGNLFSKIYFATVSWQIFYFCGITTKVNR